MTPIDTRDLIMGLLVILLTLGAAEYVTREAPATPRWLFACGPEAILAGLWGVCSAMLIYSLLFSHRG